jgi:hypothetical protein
MAFWAGDPPIFSKLAVPAIFFSVLAGVVLERWTRKVRSVPVAVARLGVVGV